MQQQEILDRVKAVVCETFGAPEDSLTGRTTARDVSGWDSVGHLIFISEIESALGVQLPMQASLDVADLDGLVALIRDAQR
jgi:acyl carrier protein